MQINYYYYFFSFTIDNKQKKNNNWAPSKIRLRLGAEVDVTRTIQNNYKNTIIFSTKQLDWHLCCHNKEKKKPDKPKTGYGKGGRQELEKDRERERE